MHTPVAGTGTGLAAALRAGTEADHEAAEGTTFASSLVRGEQPRPAYAALLTQLVAVYDALEGPAGVLRDDPLAGPFVDERLFRAAALRRDLDVLGGPVGGVLPATEAYAARIAEVGATWPAGWVAHHYTRYLGDLSGGQFVAKALRQAYGLRPDEGLSFYAFPGIGAPGSYKQAYRARLDELGTLLDADERDRVVAESVAAFRANRAVFEALEAVPA